jgi:predicted nucleic acid-binding protein
MPYLLKTVLEPGILLQAALNPDGTAVSAVRRIVVVDVEAFICPRIRSKIKAVLAYPELRSKCSRFAERAAEIQRMDAIVQMVLNRPRQVARMHNAKDESSLNLAIEVGANYSLKSTNRLV